MQLLMKTTNMNMKIMHKNIKLASVVLIQMPTTMHTTFQTG